MHALCDACAPRGEHCSGNCKATLQRILAQTEKAHKAETAAAGGPRTPQGKAVSARNATTHGLFARDIVLPSLGEDPEGYQQLEAQFTAQIAPRNLLERHYVEKIAAASWRLRRLHRWQAQLFEDETLTEDQRLDKLDKVLRHETALHRQIDTAVKMLNKDVPQLSERRARDQALLNTMQTELDCRENRENELEVCFEARDWLKQTTTADPPLDHALLDAAPAPSPSDSPRPPAGQEPGMEAENCQNELLSPPSLVPQTWGGGASLSSPSPNREGSALAPGLGSDAPGVGTEPPEISGILTPS